MRQGHRKRKVHSMKLCRHWELENVRVEEEGEEEKEEGRQWV
jgi:hypothetical protein